MVSLIKHVISQKTSSALSACMKGTLLKPLRLRLWLFTQQTVTCEPRETQLPTRSALCCVWWSLSAHSFALRMPGEPMALAHFPGWCVTMKTRVQDSALCYPLFCWPFFVAANSRIKAELFVLALVGERKNLGFVYVTSCSFLTVSSQSRTSPLVSCRAHFSRLILDAFCHRSRGNCFPNIPPTPFYQAIIEQKGELWKDMATRTPQICETLQLALFLCPKTLFAP